LSTLSLKKSLQELKPFQCLLCRDACAESLCEPCANSFIRNTQACPVCAQPVNTIGICGRCENTRRYFDCCIAPLIYSYPLDHLIWQFKYHSGPELSQLLIKPLSEQLLTRKTLIPELIVPVPLHPKRQRERGYNQSLILAKIFSKQLDLPIDNSCFRKRETAVQSLTKISGRKKNVKDAFDSDADFTGKSVAIVDDVITSGATVNELAKQLKRKGADYVEVWAIAIKPL